MLDERRSHYWLNRVKESIKETNIEFATTRHAASRGTIGFEMFDRLALKKREIVEILEEKQKQFGFDGTPEFYLVPGSGPYELNKTLAEQLSMMGSCMGHHADKKEDVRDIFHKVIDMYHSLDLDHKVYASLVSGALKLKGSKKTIGTANEWYHKALRLKNEKGLNLTATEHNRLRKIKSALNKQLEE